MTKPEIESAEQFAGRWALPWAYSDADKDNLAEAIEADRKAVALAVLDELVHAHDHDDERGPQWMTCIVELRRRIESGEFKP